MCGSKSDIFKNLVNYFLKLLSAPISGKFIFTKKSFQDFLSSLNAVISTTEFIKGHVGGNLEEELHYFAAKNGLKGWADLVLP